MPLCQQAAAVQRQYSLWWGTSADIAGIGILRREGVKTRDFLSIGIPFTLAAVIPANLVFPGCFQIIAGKLFFSFRW